jgi:hypothetical protein
MEDFKKFILSFNSLTSWLAKGVILAPFLALVYSLGPPYPDIKAVCITTSLFQLLSLMYVFSFWTGTSKRKLQRSFKVGLLLFALGFISYILFFQFFTIPTNSKTTLVVKGFVVRQEIKEIIEPTFTLYDAFKGYGYDPIRIWEPWSVYVMRTGLLMSWLLVFICATVSIALFTIIQRKK